MTALREQLSGAPLAHGTPLRKLKKCLTTPAAPELGQPANWWDSPPYWYPHVGHNQVYCKQQVLYSEDNRDLPERF